RKGVPLEPATGWAVAGVERTVPFDDPGGVAGPGVSGTYSHRPLAILSLAKSRSNQASANAGRRLLIAGCDPSSTMPCCARAVRSTESKPVSLGRTASFATGYLANCWRL